MFNFKQESESLLAKYTGQRKDIFALFCLAALEKAWKINLHKETLCLKINA